MHPILEQHQETLRELCRRNNVRRLEAFGSATGEGFEPARSDLDFLVEFPDLGPVGLANSYLELLVDLQDLFGRRVDLVMSRAIRNPYFLESVNRSRLLLYAA